MKKNDSIKKTNAARMLDQAGIAYELIPYEVDEEHLSADAVAAKLGEDIACVYKTIVLHGDRNGHFVCVVRGDSEIDLKEAARVSGNKRAELIDSCQGTPSPDRLHPWRLLSRRHEETISHLLPGLYHRSSLRLCQRRYARPPAQDCSC